MSPDPDASVDPQPTWPSLVAQAGVGEVWSWSQRLASVYYELTGQGDALLRTGAPVMHHLSGTLTLLTGDWWLLLGRQEWGLELHLEGGRLPFLIYGGARPMLWIRVLDGSASLALGAGSRRGIAGTNAPSIDSAPEIGVGG